MSLLQKGVMLLAIVSAHECYLTKKGRMMINISDKSTVNKFLDSLTEQWDNRLDVDGVKYAEALEYISKLGINSRNLNELSETCDEVNAKQRKLLDKLSIVNAAGDVLEADRIVKKTEKLQRITIGLLSMMLDLKTEIRA